MGSQKLEELEGAGEREPAMSEGHPRIMNGGPPLETGIHVFSVPWSSGHSATGLTPTSLCPTLHSLEATLPLSETCLSSESLQGKLKPGPQWPKDTQRPGVGAELEGGTSRPGRVPPPPPAMELGEGRGPPGATRDRGSRPLPAHPLGHCTRAEPRAVWELGQG